MKTTSTDSIKIILTGFEPFGNNKTNISWEIVKALPEIEGIEMTKLCLPVSFNKAADILIDKIDEINPDFIVSLGLAANRDMICLERIFVNIDDAVNPDNDGYKPTGDKICEEGDAAYFTTIPIENILRILKDNHIDSRISNNAGTYVCNHLMYKTIHHIKEHGLKTGTGFIHVPSIKGCEKEHLQDNIHFNEMVKALNLYIKYLSDSQ